MREHIERLHEINKTGDEIRDDTETSEYPANLKEEIFKLVLRGVFRPGRSTVFVA